MSRYVTKRQPRACGWVDSEYRLKDGEPLVPGCDVDENKPADTGLVTATGEPIMRLPNPMGFGRDKEW